MKLMTVVVAGVFVLSGCLKKSEHSRHPAQKENSSKVNLAYFPESYEQSRKRFQVHTEIIKSHFDDAVIVAPFYIDKEDELAVDAIYIPAQEEKKNLFVLVSGVHGPEAYAGAAIQDMFFTEMLSVWKKEGVLKHTGILVVHSMNPWGFKYHRRGTKSSINLNRNFMLDDFVPVPNPEYEKVKNLIRFDEPIKGYFCDSLATGLGLGYKLAVNQTSIDNLERALGMGQYTDPKGVSYGGEVSEPQVKFLEQVLNKVIPGYDQVVAYDLHTGLGEKDQLHMIMSETASESSLKFWEKTFSANLSKKNFVLTDPLKDHGFYATSGDFNEFVEKISTKNGAVAHSITVEFGTLGVGFVDQTQLALLLILENQGYHNGYEEYSWPLFGQFSSCEEAIKRKYLDLFYPNRENWKKSVLSKAKTVLELVKVQFD